MEQPNQTRNRRIRVYIIKTTNLDQKILNEVYDKLSVKNSLLKFVIKDNQDFENNDKNSAFDICNSYRQNNKISQSDFVLLLTSELINANLLSDSDDNNNIAIKAKDWDNNYATGTILYLIFTELIVLNFPEFNKLFEFRTFYSNLKEDLSLKNISLATAMKYCINLSQEEMWELWRESETLKKKVRGKNPIDRQELYDVIYKFSKAFLNLAKDKNYNNESTIKYRVNILHNNKIEFNTEDEEGKKTFCLDLHAKDAAFYIYFLIWQWNNYCDLYNLTSEDKNAFVIIYNFLKRGEKIKANYVISEFANFDSTMSKINTTIKNTITYRYLNDFLIKQEIKGKRKFGVPGLSKKNINLLEKELVGAVSSTNQLFINNLTNVKWNEFLLINNHS